VTALVVAVVLGIYLLSVSLLAASACRGAFHVRFRTAEEAKAKCLERGDYDAAFLDLPWEEFSVPSPRGFDVRGSLLSSEKPEAPTIVLIHGITWNRYFILRFGKVFIRSGWNVAAIDLAGHGASAAPKRERLTYGFGDKADLGAVLSFLARRFPQSPAFGLAGESLGAATALQDNALLPGPGVPALAFVIADCPFSSLGEEVIHQLVKRHVPRWIAARAEALASLVTKRRRGFHFEEASPAAAVLEARAPVLFIHGIEDRFVPPSMSIGMYGSMIEAGKPAELFLMPGAGHGKSWTRAPQLWERIALDFALRAVAGAPIGLQEFPAKPFPLDKAK
jgi:pimeloyl-ACP methyl ester carboxylesterase